MKNLVKHVSPTFCTLNAPLLNVTLTIVVFIFIDKSFVRMYCVCNEDTSEGCLVQVRKR